MKIDVTHWSIENFIITAQIWMILATATKKLKAEKG